MGFKELLNRRARIGRGLESEVAGGTENGRNGDEGKKLIGTTKRRAATDCEAARRRFPTEGV